MRARADEVKYRCLSIIVLISIGGCGTDDPPPTDTAAPITQGEPAAMAGSEGAAHRPGRDVYVHYCADCHEAGEGHPGTMQLGVRLGAKNAVLRSRSDLTTDYVKRIVRNGLEMMPPFRPTEITDPELDVLADYVVSGPSQSDESEQ